MEQDILPEIEKDILHAYKALEKNMEKEIYVAVRSSATAEDLPDASFAGQQETFLYVKGEKELLHYTKSCWASLWSARAMAYRQKKAYDHHKVFISVVIQEMVDAKVSGIIFTNNPLTQSENEMLVTSSYGLGELVVSGQVTPDTYIINKKHMNVVIKELGAKEQELVLGLEGERTALLEVPEKLRKAYSLTNEQLQELGRLADKVEVHYSYPQDIEWAYTNGRFYLLQARPITTLNKTEQTIFKDLSKTQIKILDDLLEHYPEAPTPLDYSIVTMSYQALLDRGEELGVRLTKATDLIKIDEKGLIRLQPPKIKLTWKLITIPRKFIKATKEQDKRWAELSQEVNIFMKEMKGLKVKDLSTQELIDTFNSLFDLAKRVSHLRFYFIVNATMLPLFSLSTIIKVFTSKQNRPALSDVITTNLDYKTSIIDKKLTAVALQIAQYPKVKTFILDGDYKDITDFHSKLFSIPNGKQIWDSIQHFLDQYGYRTEKMYQPFISKSWLDDQISFLDILKATVQDPHLEDRRQKEAERAEKYHLWHSNFEKKLKGPFNKLFRWSYQKLRNIYIYREETVFFIESIFHYGRRVINELGSRLAKEGILENTKDMIYIKKEELEENFFKSIDKQLIKHRKDNLGKNQTNWKQSIIQLSKKHDENSDVIIGISGSNGLAEGPVRIITSVDDFKKLKQGDILVCQYTDPTWTPLFGIAAAVVSDTGGALSHAAIVAREYEIPAVLGTKIGTSSLKEGEYIVVDGTTGRVLRK